MNLTQVSKNVTCNVRISFQLRSLLTKAITYCPNFTTISKCCNMMKYMYILVSKTNHSGVLSYDQITLKSMINIYNTKQMTFCGLVQIYSAPSQFRRYGTEKERQF